MNWIQLLFVVAGTCLGAVFLSGHWEGFSQGVHLRDPAGVLQVVIRSFVNPMGLLGAVMGGLGGSVLGRAVVLIDTRSRRQSRERLEEPVVDFEESGSPDDPRDV